MKGIKRIPLPAHNIMDMKRKVENPRLLLCQIDQSLDNLLNDINALNNLLININDISHFLNNDMSSLQFNSNSHFEEIFLKISLPGTILSLMVIVIIVEFLDIELLIVLKERMLNLRLDLLECQVWIKIGLNH